MTHQQLQWVGGLSLLIAAFCLIALVGWTHEEPAQPNRSAAILGTWDWYEGTMQVKSDGTCQKQYPFRRFPSARAENGCFALRFYL